MTTTPSPDQLLDRFSARARSFGDVVRAASPQWDEPTPCEGWTVRDVVRHTIETERDFLAQRELPLGPVPDLADPASAWASHADQVAEAVGRPGVPERAYDSYFGRTTIAATLADFYGWDLVVHGWDVARATGQDHEIDDAEALALSATADGWGPALHSEGICGPALDPPGDATPGERLLARLGRDPHWTPGGLRTR